MVAIKVGKRQQQRIAHRDEIWPDSPEVCWSSKNTGWAPLLPRIVPLVAVLANHLAPKGKGDPALAYIDLWFRTDGDGFVRIGRTDELAVAAGFSGQRGLRSWEERMRVLEELGLIRIQGEGMQAIAFVLLLNPVMAAKELIETRQREIPPTWLTYYQARLKDMEIAPV